MEPIRLSGLAKEQAAQTERMLAAEWAQKRSRGAARSTRSQEAPPNGPAPTDLGRAAGPPDGGLGAESPRAVQSIALQRKKVSAQKDYLNRLPHAFEHLFYFATRNRTSVAA